MDASRSNDRLRRRIAWLAFAAVLGHAPSAASSISLSSRSVERGRETDEPPSMPLPRMPGMTKLSSSAKFDAATNTWTLKAAFRVNAHVPHVIAFYRKALADEALEVEDVAPATDDGAYVLLGKNDRVRAQVGIRTKPHELETRVWLLWRVRA